MMSSPCSCVLTALIPKSHNFFFFLMNGHPPRSTLFPSPTLSRSRNSPLAIESSPSITSPACLRPPPTPSAAFPPVVASKPPIPSNSKSGASMPQPEEMRQRASVRSEEHTSELQSRLHLVCRLLLV